MADMAESYEVNVAPHNYCGGYLGDVMSAHFAAAVPNLRIMEHDVDDVPWKTEFLTSPPVIENGEMIVPQGPGWGTDVNEAAVRAHPPNSFHRSRFEAVSYRFAENPSLAASVSEIAAAAVRSLGR